MSCRSIICWSMHRMEASSSSAQLHRMEANISSAQLRHHWKKVSSTDNLQAFAADTARSTHQTKLLG